MPVSFHPAAAAAAEVERARKYPFSIIYLIRGDDVVITAVAHHKRRPGYWADRNGAVELPLAPDAARCNLRRHG